jgi:hypothetical protein
VEDGTISTAGETGRQTRGDEVEPQGVRVNMDANSEGPTPDAGDGEVSVKLTTETVGGGGDLAAAWVEKGRVKESGGGCHRWQLRPALRNVEASRCLSQHVDC